MIYSFVCAGATLLLMSFLSILSRAKTWRRFEIIQMVIAMSAGVGIALTALVRLGDIQQDIGDLDGDDSSFDYSPWPLPMLCLVIFTVLIVSSLPSSWAPYQKKWNWLGRHAKAMSSKKDQTSPRYEPNGEHGGTGETSGMAVNRGHAQGKAIVIGHREVEEPFQLLPMTSSFGGPLGQSSSQTSEHRPISPSPQSTDSDGPTLRRTRSWQR